MNTAPNLEPAPPPSDHVAPAPASRAALDSPRTRLWIAFALVAVGTLLRKGELPLQVLFAAVLLLLDALGPAWYARRAPSWMRRPRLEFYAAVVLGLSAVLAAWTLGNLLWLGAAAVLGWGAYQGGTWQLVKHDLAQQANAAEGETLPEAEVHTGSTRAVGWTVGLFVAAWLLSNVGNGIPGAPWIGLLWVAAVLLVIIDTWMPRTAARLPSPWLRRPLLGSWGAAVFALFATAVASWTPSSLLITAGTLIFFRDAAARGELGNFDPRLLWHGWPRRLLTGGALLAMMTLTSDGWDNRYSTPGYSTSHSSTSTEYGSSGNEYEVTRTTTEWVPSWSGGGNMTAEASWPGWLLLAALAWACRRRRTSLLSPMRWLPVGVAGVLFIWVLKEIHQNRAYANGVKGGSGYVLEGSTPQLFLIFLFIFAAGALMLSLRTTPAPADG